VAKITEKPLSCPQLHSKLWSLEIDTARVNPVIALLSAFAFHDFTLGSCLASLISVKPPRLPKPVILVFEDNMGGQARSWANEHIQEPDGDDKDDEPGRLHLNSSPSVEIIRVFERKKLMQYRIPDFKVDAIIEGVRGQMFGDEN
jgi:hypothetical protein